MSVEGIVDISSSSQQGRATVTLEFEVGRDIDVALQDVADQDRAGPAAPAARRSTRRSSRSRTPRTSRSSGSRSPGPLPPQSWPTSRATGSATAPDGRGRRRGHLRRLPRAEPARLARRRRASTRRASTVDDVLAAIRREHVELPGRAARGAERREWNVRAARRGARRRHVPPLVVAERGRRAAPRSTTWPSWRTASRTVARWSRASTACRRRGWASASSAAPTPWRSRRRCARARGDPADAPRGRVRRRHLRLHAASIEESIHEIELDAAPRRAAHGARLLALPRLAVSRTINVLLAIPTSLVGHVRGHATSWASRSTPSRCSGSRSRSASSSTTPSWCWRTSTATPSMGKDRVTRRARRRAEITFAAIAATLAIMAIFLPVAFMKGIVGKFFFQFGVTISRRRAALAPRGAHAHAGALRADPRRRASDRARDRAAASSARFDAPRARLRAAARARAAPAPRSWCSLAASSSSPARCVLAAGARRASSSPSQDRAALIVRVSDAGRLDARRDGRALRRREEVAARAPEVEHVFVSSAASAARRRQHRRSLFVTLVPRDERDAVGQTEFIARARARSSARSRAAGRRPGPLAAGLQRARAASRSSSRSAAATGTSLARPRRA